MKNFFRNRTTYLKVGVSKGLKTLNQIGMTRSFGISFVVIVGFVSVFSSCEKEDIDAPSRILDKVNEIQNEEVRNPPAQVWKWVADGEVYYYITSDCCDQFNYLYDSDCYLVCAPDGGITGDGDGQCPEFTGVVEKTLIWEDTRE